MTEVLVLGGGPAGSTVARLLAAWGRSVLLLTRAPDRARSLAESLPPSALRLLDLVGARDTIARAGFVRTLGNTSWWEDGSRRAERFDRSSRTTEAAPRAHGYQVVRHRFDALLLDLAERAGVDVRRDAVVTDATVGRNGPPRVSWTDAGVSRSAEAPLVLDCSGRAGLVARHGLRKPEPRRTMALVGSWRLPEGWGTGVEGAGDTLVESYEDGWAWSIPVDARARQFTVMVDPRFTRPGAGGDVTGPYLEQIARTRRFAALVSSAERLGPAWACDASVYAAHQYAGAGFLLVGDAGSFVDPLSSAGVTKALGSAWLAAVVANTCVERPDMASAARDLFDARERAVAAGYARLAASFFDRAAGTPAHPFWSDRASAGDDHLDLEEPSAEGWLGRPDVHEAFERLKRSRRLRAAPSARVEARASVRGRLITTEDRLVGPRTPGGLRWLRGLDLIEVHRLAAMHGDVPPILASLQGESGSVALPELLTALSVLIAAGLVEVDD